MPFYYMVEPCLGLLNDRKSFHCQQPRASMSQSPMPQKKTYGSDPSSPNSSISHLNRPPFFLIINQRLRSRKINQYHPRTKHIDIRFHFIRWIIENGSLRLIYCPTEDMLADTLTKALPSPKVKHFAVELGLALV